MKLKKWSCFIFGLTASVGLISLSSIISCSSNELHLDNEFDDNEDPDLDNNSDLNNNVENTTFPESNWNKNDDQFKHEAPASFSSPIIENGKTLLNPASLATGTRPQDGFKSNPKLLTNTTNFDQVINNVKRSFAISFNDFNGSPHSGTAWILDYKLEPNNSYPLTWYFATNVHVIDSLKIKNETISEYQRWNKDPMSLTKHISFKTINPKFINNKNTDFGNSQQAKWLNESVGILNNGCGQNSMISAYANVRTVFLGTDFMITKPSDFSNSKEWDNLEEYADFAVFEMKFRNVEEAKKLTETYYKEKSNQFKMKPNSLFMENNLETKRFVVAGFPSKDGRIADLVVNTLASDYLNETNAGQTLTLQKNYNSFKSYPGLHDAAISIPLLKAGGDIDFGTYVNWGLIMSINYSHLEGGASGTMVTDLDNNVWGIQFASDNSASVNLVQALRSDGFNYYGYYGTYNLPAYDLIYGGAPLQKNSYFDSLKKLYKNQTNFKTNIFKNGI